MCSVNVRDGFISNGFFRYELPQRYRQRMFNKFQYSSTFGHILYYAFKIHHEIKEGTLDSKEKENRKECGLKRS